MKRSISSMALLFASVSAILGSGWLFAAYYTAKIAGPASLLAWLIGGGIAILLAFVFAELSTMFPITGSSARIPQFTHGTIASFAFAWMIWLSYAAIAPTEVQAVIQYLSYFFTGLTDKTSALTLQGYEVATVLMVLVTAINIFSLRWLFRCNNILTLMKIGIPIFISIVLLCAFYAPHSIIHSGQSHFMPYGAHSILSAIATGGIVFAFNGFKQAGELAGEAKNPGRSLPIAIVGSVLIALVVYVLLESTFLSALRPDNIIAGWHQLTLPNTQAHSPLAAIIPSSDHHWLLPILYVGAIIGPLAAALMYVSSSSRALLAISQNGYISEFFQKVGLRGSPVRAIVVNFILGMLFFLPLPGWNEMVSFLTSLMALTYAIAPVCLLALRHQAPQLFRPFKLPFPTLWCYLAFYVCTLLTFWSGWDIISKVCIGMLCGVVILLSYRYTTARGRQIPLHWRESAWIWPYFIGIGIISRLGSFGSSAPSVFGNPLKIIPFGWDFLVIAIFCFFIMQLAMRYKLSNEHVQNYIDDCALES